MSYLTNIKTSKKTYDLCRGAIALYPPPYVRIGSGTFQSRYYSYLVRCMEAPEKNVGILLFLVQIMEEAPVKIIDCIDKKLRKEYSRSINNAIDIFLSENKEFLEKMKPYLIEMRDKVQ
jgi:hypothetical protein